jgi:uncharacterized membrane protein YgcG
MRRTTHATRLAVASAAVAAAAAVGLALGAPPPGPPFPEPEIDRAVYDQAAVFDAAAIAEAETIIDAIEARSGVEIAVYTQVVGYYPSYEETQDRARALMDQWGVGQRGIDDGLVIFFDLDDSRRHGQVNLYAGAGFRSTYLSDSDRQEIFDESMLPRLRIGDLSGALLAALDRIDGAVTPEHAQELLRARLLNAGLGLIGGPIILLGLVGWVALRWYREGRDPESLDDPSIHAAGPPAGLTPAAAVVILEGRSVRRALTTAMLDLASRGELSFREESSGLLGLGARKVAIALDPPARDAEDEARRSLARRKPSSAAEAALLRKLGTIAGTAKVIEPEEVPELAEHVAAFDQAVERHVVSGGWMARRPGQVMSRYRTIGAVAFVLGIVLIVGGANVPMSGLIVDGAAATLGGGVILIVAQWMPTVTRTGALARGMLLAYKRTLQKTMEQARSMAGVVEASGLTWLETPDRAVVWGTALGLGEAIEAVLAADVEDASLGRTPSIGYIPTWYVGSGGGGGGGGGSAFSSGALPDFGGMMSVLGSVGNAPSSSGSGGGGGFGGGGGGGGGGAGGGF